MRWRLWAGLGIAVSLLAACGGGPQTGPAPSGAAAQTGAAAKPKARAVNVDLRFDWLIGGQHIGFVAAAEEGDYRQAGLDVHMAQGKGSGITLQTVASGQSTFGLVAADTAAVGISKGMPVKVIGVVLAKSPSCIFYHSNVFHLRTPRDLRGRAVVSSAGNANLLLLPAVLERYGMTMKDVKLQLVQPSSFYGAFEKNPQSVELGYIMNELPPFQAHDAAINCKLYSDFGVNTYNVAIVTTLAEIRDHPDVVKRFMAASARGWQFAMAHPGRAVADAAKLFPHGASGGNAKLLGQSFAMARKLLHTPATQGRPLFWMAASDWRQTVDLAHRYEQLPKVLPLSDYYTNAFVPS